MSNINIGKFGEALNNKADLDLNNTNVFSTLGGGQVELAQSTSKDAVGKEVVTADFVQDKSGGLPVGSILTMPFGVDESENKFRYLNGQVIIQSQFPAFTVKVKSWQSTRTNLFTTETNWQAEKTNSKLGQCGKFVIDDTAGTIRLPCVVNINGLVDLANCGVIKNESLPNITGEFVAGKNANQSSLSGASLTFNTDSSGTGAIKAVNKAGAYCPEAAAVTGGFCTGFTVDASETSSTYQDNAPVQQEAIQYPYVICVNSGVNEADRPINNYQVNNVYSYGMSQYYKGVMSNNSWLRSQGQWNDGTVYTGIYTWAVEQMNAGVDGFKGPTGFAYSDTGTTGYYWWLSTETPKVGTTVYEYANNQMYGSGVVEEVTDTGFIFTNVKGLVINTYTVTRNSTFDLNETSALPAASHWITDYDWVINTADQTFRLPILNGEESVINWDRFDTLTVSGSGKLYTAPANGCYVFCLGLAASTYFAIFKGNSGDVANNLLTNENAAIAQNYVAKISVKQGDTIRIQYNGTPVVQSARFYYAQGNGNLYYYIGDTLQNVSLIDIAKLGESLSEKPNFTQSAGASMPSDRHIYLTLGASGSTYIAPANGWVSVGGPCSGYVSLYLPSKGLISMSSPTSAYSYGRVYIPAGKGDIFGIDYVGLTPDNFYFIYAEGET